MKTRSIKGMIIPLFIKLLCFIFLVQNNVIAQNNQVKNGKTVRMERVHEVRHGKMVSTLTEDQKAKIKDLRLEHMKAIRLLKAENGELKAHLKTLNIAENPDNKAIFKTIDEMMTTRGEIMKRMVSFKEAFKAILTPDQIKELQIRELNKHSAMGERNQNRGPQGGRNFGHEQMAQRGGMNHQGQMMRRQGQMNRNSQMIQNDQTISSDTTTVK